MRLILMLCAAAWPSLALAAAPRLVLRTGSGMTSPVPLVRGFAAPGGPALAAPALSWPRSLELPAAPVPLTIVAPAAAAAPAVMGQMERVMAERVPLARVFDNTAAPVKAAPILEVPAAPAGRWRALGRRLAAPFIPRTVTHRFVSSRPESGGPVILGREPAAYTVHFSAIQPMRRLILKGLAGLVEFRGGVEAVLVESRKFLYSTYVLRLSGPVYKVMPALRDVDSWFSSLDLS